MPSEKDLKIESLEILNRELGEKLDRRVARINWLEKVVETLKKENEELKQLKLENNVDYWRGIEKAHIELHDKYYKDIRELEKSISLMTYDFEAYRDDYYVKLYKAKNGYVIFNARSEKYFFIEEMTECDEFNILLDGDN